MRFASHFQKFVMNMIFIRREQPLIASEPYQHHPYHIEHRYDQGRESNQDRTGGVGCYLRVIHCITNAEESQDIP